MTTKRRIITDEFKRKAIALLASSGRSLVPIAQELRLQPLVLRKWQRSLTTGADQASEIARLKRELARVQMERDILKNVSRSSPASMGGVPSQPRRRATWPAKPTAGMVRSLRWCAATACAPVRSIAGTDSSRIGDCPPRH